MKTRIIQHYPTLGDIQKNKTAMLQAIADARKEAIELIVFPELALTGYFLKDQVVDLAPTIYQAIQEVVTASKHIDIVFGTLEQFEHRIYNAAIYASAGTIVHTHRKVYLPTYGMFDEKRYFSAGSQIRSFETRFGKTALLICEDAWHFSSGYLAALDGAEQLIVLSASPYRDGITERWQAICAHYAQELSVSVIYANRVGVEDGVTFWGGSEYYHANGDSILQAPLYVETHIDHMINTPEIAKNKVRSLIVRDERLDVVLRELERIWRAQA